MSRLDEIEWSLKESHYGVYEVDDIKYLIDRCRRLERVANAARAFRDSMTGEWPADRFDDMKEALKEHGDE